MKLHELHTPTLILDKVKLERNTVNMTRHMRDRGVRLRPHMKTAKSIDVARLALRGNFGGITVASLNEAEYFSAHGIKDIVYGVCITPDKLPRVAKLQSEGACITLITDSVPVARELANSRPATKHKTEVMVEVDCGEHRTGVLPADPGLIDIAECVHESANIVFGGVFTHAGHSYACRSRDEIRLTAESERAAAVFAAERLSGSGLPCPNVSVGSTPTALHAQSFDGITEVRAGVYMFNDLFQAEIYSCTAEDIAVSVLTTIISHDRNRNRMFVDAGALALSKDRSTARTGRDFGFGLLVDIAGEQLPEPLCVINVHQEHGEIASAEPLPFDELPVGSRVRVLPNHACMTSAMYDRYHVIEGSDVVVGEWPRTNGWHVYGMDREAPG